MSRLVIVIPLQEGNRRRAAELIEQGPPFDLEATDLVRHEVFLSDREVIFDFETPGSEPPIALDAEDPMLHLVAEAWRDLLAGSPRKAVPVFRWERGH